jgi:methionyl-tRNA synthetase
MKDENTFYITTPIYYPSNKFTIGNSYTTVACDALARFNRMMNKDVFYLTGTDEHGQKIQDAANKSGKTEVEYLDEIIDDAKNLWKQLDISYDYFIRTTDKSHEETVQKIMKILYDKGEIYKSKYSGLYCTPCEAFWTETQLIDGKCPDCGREVHKEEEESYFFKLSQYTNKILNLYKNNPEFLEPKSRVNEMVNNFLKDGLKDLCITRTSVKWGIPVEFDKKHTVYVWIDALSNYLSALGYLSNDDKLFKKYWPANLHVVGKEIVRFHAIIWPALLMALDLPLPKKIIAHGWLLFGDTKLSKSKESKIKDVNDPRILAKKYGSDSVRLFLIKEISFGADGPYSQELFLNAYNNVLANTIGNLVSRTLSMIEKYNDGLIPEYTENLNDNDFHIDIIEHIKSTFINMEKYDITTAIKEVIAIFDRCNKYIDETEPWNLAKDENKKKELNNVLYNLSESIIKGSTLLLPFLTRKPRDIFEKFDLEVPKDFKDIDKFGNLKANIKIKKGEPLYQRLDIEKEIEDLLREV